MESLRLAGHDVEALSIGGIETCIHLPRHKIAFDIGRCPEFAVKRDWVFFTHGHMDHMGGVAYHCATRALRNMPPPTYVLPAPYEEPLERLIDVWRTIDRSEMPHRTVVLAPGEEVELPNGLVVRAFEVSHTAPAQGYAVVSRREKLKPELSGLPGDEIRRRRVELGERVTQTIEEIEVAYCGDTTIEAVERVEVRTARLLVMESTFVDGKVSPAEARSKGHIHLEDVAAAAERFENEAILLHHFSARHSAADVRAAVRALLPPELQRRVTCLLGAHGG